MVGYDEDGVAYIAGHYYDVDYGCCDFLGFEKSIDGLNWQPGKGLPYLYESWMAVDGSAESPYAGAIYIAGVGGQGQHEQVVVTSSYDGGQNWNHSRVNELEKRANVDDYTDVIVDKHGTVYVTWLRCTISNKHTGCGQSGDGLAFMFFSKSTDGGKTWSPPVLMARVILIPTECHCSGGFLPNTEVDVLNIPVIAVDNSDGAYAGSLYVAMYTWTGSYLRLQVVRSRNGGSTWSGPVAIAPPDAKHDQFFPWMSVSSSGLLGVSWLDRRNDPANIAYQPFAAISTDGGRSFQPNILLSKAFSNPNDVRLSGYLGDCSGNVWSGSTFVTAWTDGSNGSTSVEMIGGIRLR